MPSKSPSQQRLFKLVHAFKTGALKLSDLPASLADKIESIAKSITKKAAGDFAKTTVSEMWMLSNELENLSEHDKMQLQESMWKKFSRKPDPVPSTDDLETLSTEQLIILYVQKLELFLTAQTHALHIKKLIVPVDDIGLPSDEEISTEKIKPKPRYRYNQDTHQWEPSPTQAAVESINVDILTTYKLFESDQQDIPKFGEIDQPLLRSTYEQSFAKAKKLKEELENILSVLVPKINTITDFDNASKIIHKHAKFVGIAVVVLRRAIQDSK